MFSKGFLRMRIESGTCNVCSAPCSSCMHYNRSMSAIGSRNESGFGAIICGRVEEADSSSVVNLGGMPTCKSRIYDDLQHVASETSNLISTTSSLDSCFENADSRAIFTTSNVYDASDDVDMPQDVSSREFVEEEQTLRRKPGHGQVSSHANISAKLGHRFSSGQGEEQSELDCHGDNILDTSEVRDANVAVSGCKVDVEKKGVECRNMTISSSFKGNNMAIPNEGGDGNRCLETRETHSIVRKLNGTGDASLLANICNSASVNTVSSVKSQLPLPQCVVFPEESIRRAEMDNVESSSASLTSGSSKHKSIAFSNLEASTPSGVRTGFSSGKTKIGELCQESRAVSDFEEQFDNDSKGSHVNAPLETIGTVLDATKGQGPHVQTQATTEGENFDSDLMLDDVKVCDICGDAGREDLLAICSKCSDGAEHTYCMSEMLHKVPEGDWLCEECKIKETKNQNVDECEAVSGRLDSTCSNEAGRNALSILIPKKLPKLDVGSTDLVTPGASKGLQSSHLLTQRQADHLEEGKACERNGALVETASPRKKHVLSRQFSLKNQAMEKVKTSGMQTLSEVQPAKGSGVFSRTKASLSSSSFKGQSYPHSPHGLLSRSVSFSYSSSVSKVKTFIENAPLKQKIMKESTTNDSRKEGFVKSLSKTTSFNNTTSGRPNTEPVSKSSSFKLSVAEGLRGPKEVKERSTAERKNISAMQNSFVRQSAAVVASNYPMKVDAKSAQSDGKVKSAAEADVPRSSKGFNDTNDLGSNEAKKQTSFSSKIFRYPDGSKAEHLKKLKPLNKATQASTNAANGSNRKVEIISPHSVVQSSEAGRKDESMRDSPTAFGGSQKLPGHVTQNYSVDKLRKSANKVAAEGNPSEVVKKRNKWREIVDVAISRSGVRKRNKPDACEELPAAKADANCEPASKNPPSASIEKNNVPVVECGNGKGISKDSNVDSTKNLAATNSGQTAVPLVEVPYVSKADDLSNCHSIGKLSEKPFAETLQYQATLSECASKASAIPKLECIWQGSFNVLGTRSCSEKFDGIQAHLSSCASHRVFEAAIKVPGSVHLEEAPHISLWPSHFQRIGPQEENIALFFFANDAESYERSYRKLMDRMQKNDLALRGNIDGIELLIFTSNKLPKNSQRWNTMYYLWGMFRAKRGYGLPVMGGQKRLFMPNLNIELPNQNFSMPPIAHVRNAQNSENSTYLNKLSECGPSTMTPREPTDAVEKLEVSIQNSSQVVADPNVPLGQPSTVDPLRVTDSPKSMLLMSASNCCSEEKNDGALQKNFVSDSMNKKTRDSSALAHDLGEESSLRRASSVPLGSPNCNRGHEFRKIEGNLRDKECSTSCVAVMHADDPRQNVLDADQLNNRKRGRSYSIERQCWASVEDEREPKKTCYAGDTGVADVNGSSRFSSKIHPLYSSAPSQQMEGEQIYRQPAMLENSGTTERCFFPTDLSPVQNNKSANIIHIPSSDDEDAPETCAPDLELALGGTSKPAKPAALPLPFVSVGGKRRMPFGSSGDDDDDGDDLSASLSLSLGFPAADRERSAKKPSKKELVLPEKPSADTSLFLFGSFGNS